MASSSVPQGFCGVTLRVTAPLAAGERVHVVGDGSLGMFGILFRTDADCACGPLIGQASVASPPCSDVLLGAAAMSCVYLSLCRRLASV